MEKELLVIGDALMELKEAKQLEISLEESTPLSVTRDAGGFISIICC